MRRLALLVIVFLMLVANAAFCQEVPDTLALSDEDAKTCQVKACRTITDATYQMIAERLARAERLEAMAQAMAAELKKRPIRMYCM